MISSSAIRDLTKGPFFLDLIFFLIASLYLFAFSPIIIISLITGYSIKLTNNIPFDTETFMSSKKFVE